MRILVPLRSVFAPALLAVTAFVGMMAIPGSSPAAYALTNCTITGDTFDSEEQKFLQLINAHRGSSRVPLTASTNLNRAAAWHAKDMATYNYFSHTDRYGRSSNTRIKQCDAYVTGAGTGENIAAGTVKDTAAEAFEMWKGSSGHNTNMLRPEFRQIGIARYYYGPSRYDWYWVTDFSTKSDGTNAMTGSSGGGGTTPTPTPTSSPSPTPTPSTSTAASMTSPTPGSRFSSSTVTFNWSSATGALEYRLYVGTTVGASNEYGASTGLNRTAQVTGLPDNGNTLYVRLWTRTSAGWLYRDYTYRAEDDDE